MKQLLPVRRLFSNSFYIRINSFIKSINKLFLYTVIIPTLLAVVYFGILVSDVYLSESSFVVRHAKQQGVEHGTATLSEQAIHSIHDYMLSREVVHELNKQFHLATLYGNSQIDLFNRFVALTRDNSFEALYLHYKKWVNVKFDSSSAVFTFQVRAYNGKDAYQINKVLLDLGRQFVSKLNQKFQKDTLDFARADVADAEKKVKKTSLALIAYQQNKINSASIRNMQSDASQTIFDSAAKTKNNAISENSTRQDLVLDKTLAYKQLANSLSFLNQAQMEVQRNRLYLQIISQPNEPDRAFEPHRLRNIFSVFILGFIFWGVLTLLIANLKEHLE